MAELTDSEINAAIERGHIAQQTEPRADAVCYDKRNSRIIVDLTNGCTFAFPPRVAQGLEAATDEDLAAVEILGAGYGVHPRLAGGTVRNQSLYGPAGRAGQISGESRRRPRKWPQGRQAAQACMMVTS